MYRQCQQPGGQFSPGCFFILFQRNKHSGGFAGIPRDMGERNVSSMGIAVSQSSSVS